eukprot:6182546-Pleurochrysis_carterae.AAC.1
MDSSRTLNWNKSNFHLYVRSSTYAFTSETATLDPAEAFEVAHIICAWFDRRESEQYLWSMQGTTLELTHNHGSEHDPTFSVWSGNQARGREGERGSERGRE